MYVLNVVSNTASTFEFIEGGAFACMRCQFIGSNLSWSLTSILNAWYGQYGYSGGSYTLFMPTGYLEGAYTESNPLGALYFEDSYNNYGDTVASIAGSDVLIGYVDDSLYFNECTMDKLVGDETAGFHFSNSKARIINSGPTSARRRLVNEDYKL